MRKSEQGWDREKEKGVFEESELETQQWGRTRKRENMET